MQPQAFSDHKSGRLVKSPQGYWYFMPHPLPPDLGANWGLTQILSQADRSLSELAGIARNLPNPHLLIAPFVRREAVSSSRIEGTQASLSDLFYFEADRTGAHRKNGMPADVHEVNNYVIALEYGLRRLTDLPISLRLIREMHEKLMDGIRGASLTPGQFRRSQNWIGAPGCTLMEAVYVPPAPEIMEEALGSFEKYLHTPASFPPLINLAMVHYQFEAIHPFLDGNGRIGRLLISLLLCHEKLLAQPLLYLSAYFERNRRDYYRHLLAVSQSGEWQNWIRFFLAGILEQSRDAIWRTDRLLELWKRYRSLFSSAKSAGLLLGLVDYLFENPVISARIASDRLQISRPAARKIILKLVAADILRETTGRQRHRLYVAQKIMDIIQQDRS